MQLFSSFISNTLKNKNILEDVGIWKKTSYSRSKYFVTEIQNPSRGYSRITSHRIYLTGHVSSYNVGGVIVDIDNLTIIVPIM